MKRIVLADDSDLVIIGAEATLAQAANMFVLGRARSMDALNAVLKETQTDLLLLGDGLHNLDTLSVIQQISRHYPTLKIIVMGWLMDGGLIRQIIQTGAQGYLYKGDDIGKVLITALEQASRHNPYLSPTANTACLIAARSRYRFRPLDAESRQVLALLAKGLPANEIAELMALTQRRVYWVREKLRRRFGARTNEHLIQCATAEGFIYPRD